MLNTNAIQIHGKDITLEGEAFLPDLTEAQRASAVPVILCHPHPQYGGDMHNNVVSALFQEFAIRRVPVIRFNFRGTGRSTGEYAGGIGEIDDVKSVIQEFCMIVKAEHAFVAGYSFGAAIGGAAAAEMDNVIGYAAIAMPFDLFPEHARRMNCAKPKLFVQGTEDDIATYSRFHRNTENLVKPIELRVIAGADHFYARESTEVARYVGVFYSACITRL